MKGQTRSSGPRCCRLARTWRLRGGRLRIVGPWNNIVGRKPGTLLGQEVREWCLRAREKGLRGYYAPAALVRHVIHADRLSKTYFRRWFYWRGISRALMYQQHGLDMENPQRKTLDFASVPHVAGVPRYLYRTAAATFAHVVAARLRGHETLAFEQELLLWMYAGIARQRWKDRATPFAWTTRGSTSTTEGVRSWV